MSSEAQSPWHSKYPTPSFEHRRIGPKDLADMIREKKAGIDFIVVDVRRTDFEKSFIKHALNLPAHSFFPTVSSIVTILSPIPIVVFHCNNCGETGRGPRAAGWYVAELHRRGIETSEAVVLDGGIKAFDALFGEDDTLVSKLPE